MDQKRINEIKARLAKATLGPWIHTSFDSGTEYVTMRDVGKGFLDPDKADASGSLGARVELHNVPAFEVLQGETEEKLEEEQRANAEFIAHARQDVEDLVAEIERLRGTRHS